MANSGTPSLRKHRVDGNIPRARALKTASHEEPLTVLGMLILKTQKDHKHCLQMMEGLSVWKKQDHVGASGLGIRCQWRKSQARGADIGFQLSVISPSF